MTFDDRDIDDDLLDVPPRPHLFSPTEKEPPPFERLLIIQLADIGDLVLTTPAIAPCAKPTQTVGSAC